ncbi:segregation and condensation protein A [Scatolibacter rhodanostii]|uniref:segregation and condensation protein A n=1 Tax=Scatolibacter rhodanostii TaxID=2014781 RepID=UPI000C080E11|nr:segregation/condensation protein A [Scatolibacter rhodanostii]
MTTQNLQYTIGEFQGPLDLLLTLITKNKINIYDIPITELLAQYMEQIDLLQSENLDIASEFLEMAARLVHIKTVSLLPKQEEAEELKMELTGQLIEYQQCKQAAENLGEMFSYDFVMREPMKLPVDTLFQGHHTPQELLSALWMAIGKGKSLLPPKPESFSGIVSQKIVSVTSQVVSVLRKLWKNPILSFREIFAEKKEKSERVAAFLAILELIKGNRIYIEGADDKPIIKLSNGGKQN